MNRLRGFFKAGAMYLMPCAMIVLFVPGALADEPQEMGLNSRTELHDHDHIRDRDRLHGGELIVLTSGDEDRSRTRDRLRDCDLNLLVLRPTFGLDQDRIRNQVQNQYRYLGILAPESQLFLGMHQLIGWF